MKLAEKVNYRLAQTAKRITFEAGLMPNSRTTLSRTDDRLI